MPTVIRRMEEKDRASVLELMRVFYASPAVWSNGSDEIFHTDIDACVGESPYLEGYVFETEGVVHGYAMLAKSFSTEFGRPCIWIEDLFIQSEYRGEGLGDRFLQYVEKTYPHAVLRLEVEAENKRAVKLYQQHGYEFLPYMEMKR